MKRWLNGAVLRLAHHIIVHAERNRAVLIEQGFDAAAISVVPMGAQRMPGQPQPLRRAAVLAPLFVLGMHSKELFVFFLPLAYLSRRHLGLAAALRGQNNFTRFRQRGCWREDQRVTFLLFVISMMFRSSR